MRKIKNTICSLFPEMNFFIPFLDERKNNDIKDLGEVLANEIKKYIQENQVRFQIKKLFFFFHFTKIKTRKKFCIVRKKKIFIFH